ncbi:JAB domain-containing protein [Geomonas propionica]|uniref:DNA repair protein RadC n=1 Tax=Geomonas propionica TaxID=2798582 RepID=A0ABS0YP54_9BACT|nr:DNA repair protein RadC [Geomonas propionica]
MSKVKSFYLGDQAGDLARTVRLRVIRPVFGREAVREDLPAYFPGDRFTSPRQVYELFRDLTEEPREQFLALYLDAKNRIICFDRVSIGSLNQTIVHPREVFQTAMLSSAAALLLIHNHPSGDPEPSPEDIGITKRLKECGDLLGINILDHVVIGEDGYVSFVEHGLL